MSCYESMLLGRGGGIFPEPADNGIGKNDKNTEAGLVIGLGGTGIAALHAVRENFLREKEMPGIRFLTVDEGGEADISLLAPGRTKPSTRQRGRAMMAGKAGELREKILELCRSALSDEGAGSLSVFILAGLSGITGGSCCADLCYIVRDVFSQIEDADTSLHGMFFLPDVAQSSPAVFGHRDIVERRYEQACGYAALTELDSLMRMTGSGKKFSARYEGGFTIDTDERPVDFFHLISASNEYGNLSSGAYETCLGTAAGYIAEYFRMPENIRKEYGRTFGERSADSAYITVTGVSQRLLPFAQISTFMASRFCTDFQAGLKERREPGPDYAQLHDTALSMGLETETLLTSVTEGCPEFQLPETDMRELRACGAVSDGEFPSVWSEDIENWMDACARVRKENCRNLKKEFRDRIEEKISLDMYTKGRGPYYVRDFLSRRGSDIREMVHEIREDVRDRFHMEKESLYGRGGRGGLVTELERASADFVRAGLFGRGKKYERYKEAALRLIRAENEILLLADAGKLLKKTDTFVEKYEKNRIEPLLEVLENLSETAAENMRFLESLRTAKAGFARPFFRLEDLGPDLTDVLKETDRAGLEGEFLTFLQRILRHPGQKKTAERRIRGWLGATFGSLCMEAADGYIIRMQEQTQRALKRLCRNTTGQLWCGPAENGETQAVFLDVPRFPSSLSELARTAAGSGILYSRTENEITAVRVRHGVSLSSYRGLSQMEKEYLPYRESDEMNPDIAAK